MRFFPVFLFSLSFSTRAKAAPVCLPVHLTHAADGANGETGAWLLLAALVVCIAGRLAAPRHG